MYTCSIRDYGAQPGEDVLCTAQIQKAIDTCARGHGGWVHVPPGTYRSGALQLRSGVTLVLERGARLCAHEEPALYPRLDASEKTSGHKGFRTAFIWADGATHTGIIGEGIIDGGYGEDTRGGMEFRPGLVFFRACRDVAVRNVTLRGANFWTLHLLHCEDVHIHGITIRNNRDRINTDGIDPDGCRNVIISDCTLECGDDCVCLKSSSGQPCTHIVVSNCICTTTCAALKIGTESTADIRDVTMHNCVIHDAATAIALYMKDGALYEDMLFSGIRIQSNGPYPVVIDASPRFYTEHTCGMIRDIVFESMIITGGGRLLCTAPAQHPMTHVVFRNITWKITGVLPATIPPRPRGSMNSTVDPQQEPYEQKRAHFTFVGMRDTVLSQVHVRDIRTEPSPQEDTRIPFFAAHADTTRIETMQWCGRQLGRDDVRLQDCGDIQIT